MILVSLNIWGGVLYQPLIKFIKDYSDKVDIFCFQEVFSTNSEIIQSHNIRANIYQEIEKNYLILIVIFRHKLKKGILLVPLILI